MRLSRTTVTALVFALALARPAFAADPLAEAKAVESKLSGYSMTVTVHESKNGNSQDRVYSYVVKKPHHVELEIVSGPGKGSGATWDGGDTVSGHLGGILRGIHKTVSLHDPQATSLRGDTIDSGTLEAIVTRPQTVGTKIVDGSATVDGQAADTVSYEIKDPAADGGITKEVLYLSKATHLPIKRERFTGDQVVKSEKITEFKAS